MVRKPLPRREGFEVREDSGRWRVFRAGSKELKEYNKDGELTRHVTRPRAGLHGLTLKSPDTETLEAYRTARSR
jgi:hypothetical protein